MPTDSTPLLREITITALKIALTVIALALVYPFIVTAITNGLRSAF